MYGVNEYGVDEQNPSNQTPYIEKNMNIAIMKRPASTYKIMKVPAWKNNRIFLFNPCEILYYEAQNGLISVITSNGDTYTNNEPLHYWENRLKDHKFFRCHRSYLVNLDFIEEIIPTINNTYELKLKAGWRNKIPVSRNYLKCFKQLIGL